MMAIRKQENEIYNKNGFVVLDKFIEYETSLILFHHVMMSARRAKYAQVNEPDLYDDEKQHYGHFDNAGGCLDKPVWNKYADGVIETVLSLATPMIEEVVGKKLMPTYSWARLYEHELQKREEQEQKNVSTKTDIGWGHQIRSYVLQPYQLVKDLRSKIESTNPDDVLNGNLDQFIEGNLFKS